jgi:hypothetical protein
MKFFHELGERLENESRSKDYNETIFPSLAAAGLRKSSLHEKHSPWQVLEWTLGETELPAQRDVPGRFGEPPITIYSAPRFHIDVYFWFQGTTSVHQHAFCGAFQVMHGSSIHSWYEFDDVDVVNAFCKIGEMRLKSCELLNVGDVQEIIPGRRYIHSLFHLDHPSVSIVIRTDKSPLFLPQFDYQKPGLAFDPFFEQVATIKKQQAIGALLRAGRADADELFTELIEDCDFHTAYLYLAFVRSHLRSDGVGQMFGADEWKNRFGHFLDIVEDRHGSRVEMLRRVFAYRDRLDDLVNRRGFVNEPEHRFFFALLLNVDSREQILKLISKRFADSDPIEKILDWSHELSQIRLAGVQNTNALGITPFDDFDLQLVEYLLNGRTDREIAGMIRDVYPPEKAEQVLPTLGARTAAIRNSIVFAPLMADGK